MKKHALIMKTRSIFASCAVILAAILIPSKADAQLYQIANQLPQLIQPALSGASSYKGFLEGGYTKTFGHYDADFMEFSTSQGFQYNSWFYMGVGVGVDVMFAHHEDQWGSGWQPDNSFNFSHPSTTTAAMLPLFTDFRATLGNTFSQFFIDLKIGCSFLLSNKYIEIGDGYMTTQQYFYLRPSIGMRIPLSTKHPKQAIDIAINYKLLTSNYWNSWNRTITLNSLGASLAFEW